MKIKTSELTGKALDYAVAVCEGFKQHAAASLVIMQSFNPSSNWMQAGPIIDQELQNGLHLHGGSYCVAKYYHESFGAFGRESYGPTPLIAAMRCYVASKFGENVEIPDELLQDSGF